MRANRGYLSSTTPATSIELQKLSTTQSDHLIDTTEVVGPARLAAISWPSAKDDPAQALFQPRTIRSCQCSLKVMSRSRWGI